MTDRRCPDAGKCHHDCQIGCWRVANAGPLSGVYPNNEWPASVVGDIAAVANMPGAWVWDADDVYQREQYQTSGRFVVVPVEHEQPGDRVWVCSFWERGGSDVACTPETGGLPDTIHHNCCFVVVL